jgi:leucyl aminopeptidase
MPMPHPASHPLLFDGPADATKPIWPIERASLESWLAEQEGAVKSWLRANRFRAEAGDVLVVPDGEGRIAGAALGLGDGEEPFVFGALPARLPAGDWRIEGALAPAALERALLGFVLGAYTYDRYRASKNERARILVPASCNRKEVERMAAAVTLVRDLVNAPANDLGPAELEAAARKLAEAYGAELSVTDGERLAREFPLVHTVGAASARAPRLIDICWGRAQAPRVTLVGKGVCFDSGGLDLKPASAMALMKKDMGGAATALGLADLVMGAALDVRLRVIIPAVENSVSGNAYRPGDVLKSRKGLTVEIGNTDAEGRLVLADALALADEDSPALLACFATLTGAARTALGPDVVPFYTADDALAEALARAAAAAADPLWRMPLWKPYQSLLESHIADTNHISDTPFAGSIVAALFLAKFAERPKSFVHFDIYAWNTKAKPGRPMGGEAQAMRALYAHLRERFR